MLVVDELDVLFEIHGWLTLCCLLSSSNSWIDCHTVPLERRSVASIFAEYGPYYMPYCIDQNQNLEPFLCHDSAHIGWCWSTHDQNVSDNSDHLCPASF